MLSFDDAATYLDNVVDELPTELLRELNGGICLLPQLKRNSSEQSLYILGEYIHNRQMGRYIALYYGSFERLYRYCTDERVRTRLKEVLIHELTHHNESLAGDFDLVLKDKLQYEHYVKTGEYVKTKDIDLYNKTTE